MNITYAGSNIEITEALKTFTMDKMQKIEHREHGINAINVALTVEHVTHSANANVIVDNTTLHASAKSDDMYHAIDAMIDKLIVLINKHKDKAAHH